MTKHPADLILEYLETVDRSLGTADISKKIGLTEQECYRYVLQMKDLKPAWIALDKGDGDSLLSVSLWRMHLYDINEFQAGGGFTRLFETAERDKKQEQERQELDIEKLKLEVAELKQRPRERKSTRLLSIVAILVSIAALLLELWEKVFSKKAP